MPGRNSVPRRVQPKLQQLQDLPLLVICVCEAVLVARSNPLLWIPWGLVSLLMGLRLAVHWRMGLFRSGQEWPTVPRGSEWFREELNRLAKTQKVEARRLRRQQRVEQFQEATNRNMGVMTLLILLLTALLAILAFASR